MKPFQIIVLSVFAVLAVGGLFLFATFKGFSGGPPVGAVVIWGTLPSAKMQAVITNLKQSYKQYGQVSYVERPASTFDRDVADAIASGSGPDLIVTTQEQVTGERSKLSIIPSSTIPDRTFRDSYLPIDNLFLTSGGTYAVPFLVDPLVLYYNRDILQGANIAQPPTSWEAVVGLAPTLTKKSDASIITRSALPIGTYDNVENARAILSLLFLQSGTPITIQNAQGIKSNLGGGGGTYGSTPAESALSFYTQFADPAKLVYSWNRSLGDARQSFVAGDAAFYIGFASEQKLLAASNPNLNFDMAAIPQPQTVKTPVDYAVAYAFAIPKASHNPGDAYKTAAVLAGANLAPTSAAIFGMAPSLRSQLTPQTNDVFAPVFYPLALISQGWLSPAPSVTDGIFADMINGIVSGRQTIQEALVSSDQALNASLQ